MAKKSPRVPLPVLAVIIGIITPIELSPVLGTLHMFPHRVAILMFVIPAFIRLFASRKCRPGLFDYFFVLYNCWTLFVFIAHMDLGPGLQFGGSLVVESLGGYAVARAYIRSYDDFTATVTTLFYAICLVGLLALPEAFTGNHFIHDSLKSISGIAIVGRDETRWGLHRAFSTFNHPILYGAFCASILAMVWVAEKSMAAKIGKAMTLAGATYLGLSSAPLNMLVLQGMLGGLHRGTARFPNRMKILGVGFAILYTVLLFTSNRSPIASIVARISIDPQTAFYRTLIWSYGLDNVWAHPWFGLGQDDWARPRWMHSSTVDAFWLLITMQQGIPAFVLLMSAISTLIGAVHKRGPGQRAKSDQRASIGWTLSFVAVALGGCTVHFWDSAHTYFFVLLGMGGWLADPLKPAVKAKAKVPVVSDRQAVPWMQTPAGARYVRGLDPMAG